VVSRTPFSVHRFQVFRQPRTYARTACCPFSRSPSTHGDDRRASFSDLHLDGYGAALAPAVLQRLAGQGEVGVLDVILVSRGTGGNRLPARADLDHHPRVQHARSLRQQVRVFGDERGVVTVAQGLAGRTELSVQTWPDRLGTGRGLIQDALSLVPVDGPVFAAVAPGNARSLRAFLTLGFRALGSEVLIRPHGHRG